MGSAKENSGGKLEDRVRRGSCFCTVEDMAISKAWISVREDSIVGVELKDDTFYMSVHELFSSKVKPATTSSHSFEFIKN